MNSTLATRSYSTIAGFEPMKKKAFSSGYRKPSLAFIEQRIDFGLVVADGVEAAPLLDLCTFFPVNAEKTFAKTSA